MHVTNDRKEEFVVVSSTDEKRTPIFAVLVKRTFDIRPNQPLVQADMNQPIVRVDEYYEHGDPEWATVKYENELAPYKVATDVVVIGKAYALGGTPVQEMDVSVEVGEHRKSLRVIGDRTCSYRSNLPPLFTEPMPFTEMELRYEKAYGGKDLKSIEGLEFHYPRNSMGTGLAIKNIPDVVDGLPLPNIEDPFDPIAPERVILEDPHRWNQQPLPQGIGWFQKTWYPRCSFVGAIPGFVDVDEIMREELLGLVPPKQIALARQFKLPSFDVHFNNGASPGLVLPYLQGTEHIGLKGLAPEGELAFSLPGETPRVMLDIGIGENELEMVLHTVCVQVEEKKVNLIWRGAQEYPGIDWLPEMKRMNVVIS